MDYFKITPCIISVVMSDPVTAELRALSLRWRRRPADMEGSCECTE